MRKMEHWRNLWSFTAEYYWYWDRGDNLHLWEETYYIFPFKMDDCLFYVGRIHCLKEWSYTCSTEAKAINLSVWCSITLQTSELTTVLAVKKDGICANTSLQFKKNAPCISNCCALINLLKKDLLWKEKSSKIKITSQKQIRDQTLIYYIILKINVASGFCYVKRILKTLNWYV